MIRGVFLFDKGSICGIALWEILCLKEEVTFYEWASSKLPWSQRTSVFHWILSFQVTRSKKKITPANQVQGLHSRESCIDEMKLRIQIPFSYLTLAGSFWSFFSPQPLQRSIESFCSHSSEGFILFPQGKQSTILLLILASGRPPSCSQTVASCRAVTRCLLFLNIRILTQCLTHTRCSKHV